MENELDKDKFVNALSERDRIGHEEWHRLHALCPNCKTENYCITTGGMPVNKVNCDCGWKGREYDLIPKND